MKNKLYYGDNLEVMRKYNTDESVDLCYIDPPCNSNNMHNNQHFYRRIGGILLLALAFLWLEQFKGMMFAIAKIEFVLAAILYTKMPQFPVGRSFKLEKEWRSGKD